MIITALEADKILAEAMKKGNQIIGSFFTPSSSWADYGEVLEWAHAQQWWEDVAYETVNYGAGDYNLDFKEELLNPKEGSKTIAKFLKQR